MYIPGANGFLTKTKGVDLEVENFEVFEVPKFRPTGEGEHNWALIEKKGLSTIPLVKIVARFGNVDFRDVGYAGLKDKNARTVQWISSSGSVPLKGERFRVLYLTRSRKKLKRGNLLGNWFRLTIKGDVSGVNQLSKIPNFFGPQRFSTNNHEIGEMLIKGRKKEARDLMRQEKIPFERKYFQLMEDAYCSYLFNKVLSLRLSLPELEGDIMSKHGPTGPIFGKKMSFPEGEAGELEREILEKEGLTLKDFPGTGTRRPLFIKPIGLELRENLLRFFLPRGSYATAVLREIVKEKKLTFSFSF